MTMKKHLTRLALLLLVLSFGFKKQDVEAKEMPQEMTFVLHKRVFYTLGSQESVDMRPNTGIELLPSNITEENKDLIDPTKTYGLNNVTFDVYDATNYVLKRLNNSNSSQTMEEISQEILSTNTDKLREELTKKNWLAAITTQKDLDTGEDGVAKFTLQMDVKEAKSKAILFLEQPVQETSSSVIYQITAPMLVSLPIEHPTIENEWLDTVHLYPKSILKGRLPETSKPEPTPNPKPSKPSGHLPQTGEAKTFMSIFGLTIVSTVIIIWRRRKKEY